MTQQFTYSGNVYTTTSGVQTYPLVSTEGNNIPYLQKADIHVYQSTDSGETWTELLRPDSWDFNDTDDAAVINFFPGPGAWIKVQRITPYASRFISFQEGSLLTSDQLNEGEDFSMFVDQELFDVTENIGDSKVTQVTGTTPIVVDNTDPLNPVVGINTITETEAELNPENPNWHTDNSVPTAGAVERVYSQEMGLGAGYPGDGNLGKNGKLRVDNVSAGTPDLFYWDATTGTPAWVQVNTQGDTGPQGPPGPPPGLQDPSATATTVPTNPDGTAGDATATVTQDGNGDLQFQFGIPQGIRGPQGPQGSPGSGVTYLGAVDATTENPPADPENGDFLVNTAVGTALPAWAGLTDVTENDRLIWNGNTNTWDRFQPVATGTNLGYTAAADQGTITNDNGTDATLILANSNDAGLMRPAEHDKLTGIADGAQANVQSDWNETDTNSDAFIQNKPDIVQSDWNQTNTAQPSFIRNKPTIPAAQVQSNWTETDTGAVSFIQNKPDLDPTDGDFGFWSRDNANGVITPVTATDDINTLGDIATTGTFAGNGLNVNGMTYPTADGQAGELLTTDGNGTLGWTTVDPPPGTVIADTPPANPEEGQLWWNSDDGRLYIWFIDANSSQWVDASPDSGAMTPGVNPPNNPNNGDIWIDLGQCPPVLNIWSDCSGTGEWNPVQGGLVAPVIQQVNLGAGQGGAGRFTGATFPVEGVMAEEGNPVSQRFLRAVLTEGVQQLRANPQLRAITRPVTSEITLVEDVQFADDIVMHPSSENSWAHIGWAGPPFNRYIAYATAGSNNFYWVWSTDGETWNQFQGPKGTSGTGYGVNWIYRDVDQRIYVGAAGQNTTYNTISTLDQLLNFENNGENWVTSRPHDNSSWRSGMQYDPVNDRICCYRGPWDVSNTYMTKSPFPAALDDSGWYSCGGQGGAALSQGTMLANSLGNSYYVGSMSPHNEATYNMAYSLNPGNTGSSPSIRQGLYTRDTNGYSGRAAYCPSTNRWFVNGWYWTGDDPSNFPSSVSSWTGWTQNVPKLDGASLTHLFFSNQLNQLILLGSVKNTGDTIFQYCHWRSADGGDTWTDPILTNPVEGTYGYWSYGMEAPNLATHLLCSAGGNVAGKRFGSSQTLGSTETLPQLTFANDTGLDTFSVGNVVTQDDDAATGNIARVGPGARMIINATTGTWGPANQGRFLIGPARNYDPAWADFDQNGNITRLLPFDPGWQLMNGDGPWNLTFPATFEDGTVPDDVIPAATSLRVDLLAASDAGGFIATDEESSNEVTPT